MLLLDHRCTPLGRWIIFCRTSSGESFLLFNIFSRLSTSLLSGLLLCLTCDEMFLRTSFDGALSLLHIFIVVSSISSNCCKYRLLGVVVSNFFARVTLSSARTGLLRSCDSRCLLCTPSNITSALSAVALWMVTLTVTGQVSDVQYPSQ